MQEAQQMSDVYCFDFLKENQKDRCAELRIWHQALLAFDSCAYKLFEFYGSVLSFREFLSSACVSAASAVNWRWVHILLALSAPRYKK